MRRLLHLALRAFTGAQHALRERLTSAGLALAAGGAVAAAAGIDTNQTVTYQAFALAAALLALALACSLFLRAEVGVERELPRYVTAGEPFTYRVSVRNLGRRALSDARLRERFADPRPSYAEWRAAREPGEGRRNWFDREAGYFRWRWLIERRLPRRAGEAALPSLAPGAVESVSLDMTPRRRGRLDIEGLTLSRPDPLGLAKGLTRLEAPARVVALPRRYRLPPLALPGRRRFQQGGVALAASVGDTEEFIGLRDYRPGDPLHKVHWKGFARTGKPIIKEFQDEFFERHALVLDTGRAEGEDACFEEAVSLAASFVYTIDTRECLLDLLLVGDKVHGYTTGRGQLHADHLLEVLAAVTVTAPRDFAHLARAARARMSSLSSCILILVGWDDARQELARSLLASGMELRALLVCEAARAPRDAPPWLLTLHPGEVPAGLARLQ